jgi:hypothetical protein
MPHRSWTGLTTELRLEPLFRARFAGSGGMGRVSIGDPATGHSKTSAIEIARELASLLQQLGVRADSPALLCFAHVDGATARAVESIVDWMNYLPEDCVKAMVSDGWHWST